MYRILVLTIVLTVFAADDTDRRKCFRVFHPESMRCCKKEGHMPNVKKEDLAECFKMPHSPHSCDHDICIGKIRGYASDDGTVDMDAFEKIITEDFKSEPTLLESIKESCIKNDVSKFGPPDACQLRKLKICMDRAFIDDCKEWDDSGSCAGLKDLVRECAKILD